MTVVMGYDTMIPAKGLGAGKQVSDLLPMSGRSGVTAESW
jgi:hypothetical protein